MRKLTSATTLDNLKREAKRWLAALRGNKKEARDRFERDLALLDRVRESYRRQAREGDWIVIDGEQPKDEVAAAVERAVLTRTGRRSMPSSWSSRPSTCSGGAGGKPPLASAVDCLVNDHPRVQRDGAAPALPQQCSELLRASA